MARLVGGARSLIVFPEGTRSATGAVGKFRGGTFVVAIEAGLPVVPVSIAGSRYVMRKGRLMTCPGEVTLTVHDPIPTADVARDSARALAEETRKIVCQDVDQPVSSGLS
jgi:1-acyl-sn-glycerol-3-phosphate acyltransferase